MIIIRNNRDLEQYLNNIRQSAKTIGFVPTMGALHAGHISLIKQSLQQSDITVCSIFVNPTQFNDKADLERYPRMPEKDAKMLEEAGCNVLFLPDITEIYPEEDKRQFDFGTIDKVLEGAHRPGHFNGVGQVVSRLFELVKPNKAFFGLKDYQQLQIIKKLTSILKLDIEIVPCEIMREPDGLAMSSRNMLLSTEERKVATLIPQLLVEAKQNLLNGQSVNQVKEAALKKLNANPIYKPEYIEVCDAETLTSIDSLNNTCKSIILIACFVGKIRLIDNLVIN